MTKFKFLKSERKIAPVHAVEAYGIVGVSIRSFVTSPLDGGEWSASHSVYSTCVGGGGGAAPIEF
jgi:hypothetical protein